MGTLRYATIGITITLALPGRAMAQDGEPLERTGTRVGSGAAMVYRADNSKIDDAVIKARSRATAEGIAAMHRMAACVVARRPAYATAYLSAEDDAPAARTALAKMNDVMSRCLGAQAPLRSTQVGFTGQLWRGALAEAIMRASPSPAPQPATAPKPAYSADWIGHGGEGVVREMTACIADVQPARVDGLLATLPGSAQEMAAVRDLAPFETMCLMRGATLKTNVIGLRAALAEAAYHSRADGRDSGAQLAGKN